MTTTMLAQEVKERPIIFGAESVRAILSGHKTQTRRVIKPQPRPTHHKPCQGCKESGEVVWHFFNAYLSSDTDARICSYGKRRERLWVREGWRHQLYGGIQSEPGERGEIKVQYLAEDDGSRSRFCPNEYFMADHKYRTPRWTVKSPIFMPRWASRITLELTDVRVERVQEITAADCMAEGVIKDPLTVKHRQDIAIGRFAEAWNSLNAKRGFPFESNPWVWVLTFRRAQDSRA